MTVQMWLWILSGLNIVTKVRGYGSTPFSQSCESMSPLHLIKYTEEYHKPQETKSPFVVSCNPGKKGDPITVHPFPDESSNTFTVSLISTEPNKFRGFMLEAREQGRIDEGPPVGKFILLEPDKSKLLTCGGFAGSAVMQMNNKRKSLVNVNWTAEGKELDITLRATFVQSYQTFWEGVDVNCTTPPENTSTIKPSTTDPSTTERSTTEPSTAEPSTTKPSTAELSTTKPSTAEPSTTDPSTTEPSTTEPSTAELSTTKPSTAELSTTKPSTAELSTTKPSTTELSTAELRTTKSNTTEPSTEDLSTNEPNMTTLSPITTSSSIDSTQSCEGKECYRRAGTALMCFDSLFVVLKMELSNIVSAVTTSSFSHLLNKELKTSGSGLCLAAEISALILFYVGDPSKVILNAVVIVLMVNNFMELVIFSLPFGASHELKEICNLVGKLFSVTHQFFTTAAIFVGVLEIDNCRKNWKECWLLKVMTAYSVWIFLCVIWVFVSGIYRQTILGRNKIGNSKAEGWKQQRTKRKLSAAQVIGNAVSIILIVGTMTFTAAIIYGIFVSDE